jgi:hypothetical protein
MKVPANVSGDRLILDYLTRVTVAGTRYLPKGSRIAFVGQTRNRIEREIGPHGPADPAHVREVLAKLGEPEDLVKAERARLDAERAGRQSRVTGVGGADAATGTGAIEARPINSRWRPATRARPTRPPAPGDEGGGPRDRSAGRRGAAGDGKRKGRLGGLLKDRLGPEPQAPPGAQAPPAETARSPAGRVGPAPDGTVRAVPDGPAPDGAAGPAPDSPAGQVPGGSADQAAGGSTGQAAGGPARWPPAGAGGQAPAGTGAPPPDLTGTQPLSGRTGAQPSGGTGTRSPGGTGPRPPGRTGTQAPGGTGTRPSPETGTHVPGEAGTGGGPPGSGADGRESPPLGPNGWLMPTAVIQPGAGGRQTRRRDPSSGDTPVHGIPVLRPGTRAQLEPLTARTAAAAMGRGAARLAVSAARLARRYPLETAAVTLLALGGLILPFPYWLFGGLLGGVLSIWSRMWLARDKWIAVFGPLIVVIVGTILAAVIGGGHGGAVTAYPHAFVAYAGNLLRFGNVLCAAYLVVQARRAPQRRLPPWQRQRQPPPRYR